MRPRNNPLEALRLAYAQRQKVARTVARGLTILVSAAAVIGIAPVALQAQSAASAEARTFVVGTVTLSNTRDLDFGRVIVPRNGRIDMTAQDTANCTANNGLTIIDACQSAAFEGAAASGFQLRIQTPPQRRITLSGPGRNLRLRQMTVGAGAGLAFLGRTGRNFGFLITDPAGEFEFFVAGRLLFRNNQVPGRYSGTFTIQADYE